MIIKSYELNKFNYNNDSPTRYALGHRSRSVASLDFYDIDTINSPTSDTFNINASTITFDSLATTLDNTSADKTFLFSTRQNFDLGLSSGLTTDPLLRLTDEGDIFYNLGFGTGTYDGVKLFDS